MHPTPSISAAKRVVIKIGSSLIADSTSAQLRTAWLATMAEDIAQLHAAGKEVILVSSGAVALGRPRVGLGLGALSLEEKQAAAAAGQPLLIQAWQRAFDAHGINVAQLLLTLDDTERRRRYLNGRATFATLLSHRLIPIVNENDTVATAELKFGDNDRLAARVAAMAGADLLVLFSDIEGLYDKNPHTHADAKHIPRIESLTPDMLAMAEGPATAFSNGGMKTKLEAAKIALDAGCHMAIASGLADHALQQLHAGGKASWFVAGTKPQLARKHWIASAMHLPGSVVIDDGAAKALAQGKSLLPAGVKRIEGRFDRGDTVGVKSETDTLLAKGISGFTSEEATAIAGKKTDALASILGYACRDTLIHRDDLVML
ncbi:MAG: glutamate 5-kinase [Rickettsiales bacterium]